MEFRIRADQRRVMTFPIVLDKMWSVLVMRNCTKSIITHALRTRHNKSNRFVKCQSCERDSMRMNAKHYIYSPLLHRIEYAVVCVGVPFK